METVKIECPCGQVTCIVQDEQTGLFHYALNPHGNDAVQAGCFNCRRPLDIHGLKKPPPDNTGGGADPGGDVVTEERINKMKMPELKALADASNIDLSAAKNNDERKAVLIAGLLSDDFAGAGGADPDADTSE